jgi:hypothetical protein
LLLVWLIEVQSRDQLEAGSEIEESRRREAISVLEGPDRCARLGRIDVIDRAWVKVEVLQMRFRDLDVHIVLVRILTVTSVGSRFRRSRWSAPRGSRTGAQCLDQRAPGP